MVGQIGKTILEGLLVTFIEDKKPDNITIKSPS